MDNKIYKNKSGYLCFADSGKPLHRYMAAKKLHRPLKPHEVVHHKDRNKLNNNPSNLCVFANQQDHWRAHLVDAKRYGIRASFIGKKKTK